MGVSLVKSLSSEDKGIYVRGGNLAISFYLCSVVALTLAIIYENVFHWFLIPLVLCGALVGSDAIGWLNRGTDIFNPIIIFGLYGVYFFFLAPLLHVILDYWMKYVTPPSDWRLWLGCMAWLNFLGLMIMVWARNCCLKWKGSTRNRTIWELDRKRFYPLWMLLLVCSLILQAWVYTSRGGIYGYITAYTERDIYAFQGMGLLFMISESFPILAIMGYAVFAKRRNLLKSWPVIAFVFISFLVAQVLFGGLRGSRSNTILIFLWAAGIIQLWVRPIPRKAALIGLAVMLAFMYVYGFYKSAGKGVINILRSRETVAILEEETGRDEKSLLLGDLSRSDVQAFILYRLSGHSDYELAWGRSYLGDASILIPRQLWSNRPPSKVKEGTEIGSGKGSYNPEGNVSSRVYGLGGEAMLNFGPPAVPLAYLFFGFLFGIISAAYSRMEQRDARNLLLPILSIMPVLILTSDFDNLIFFIVKNCTVPLILVFIASRRYEYNEK